MVHGEDQGSDLKFSPENIVVYVNRILINYFLSPGENTHFKGEQLRSCEIRQ